MTEKFKTKVVNTTVEIKDATETVLRNLWYLLGGFSALCIGGYAIAEGRDKLGEVLGGMLLIFGGAFVVILGIFLVAQLLTKRG